MANDNKIVQNKILNVNNEIIDECMKYLSKNEIINEDNNEKLKNICQMSLTNDGVYYKHNFLELIQNTFKQLYDSDIHIKYNLNLHQIDPRKEKDKNNEFVFINKILCFFFVIKIISSERNGLESNCVERNISIFINNNLTLTNICPHFALFITEIKNIRNVFCRYIFQTKYNSGLVYHNIDPWILTISNKKYKISDLSSLINTYCKNYNLINHKYVSNMLYNIYFQIIYSLCALGKYKINHNDLRSANILLQNGYEYDNAVDHYKIITNNGIMDFYVPNYGFKIKIIDFGLSSQEINQTNQNNQNNLNDQNNISDETNLHNPKSKYFDLLNCAGVYNIYSDIYDIHCVINETYFKLKQGFANLEIYDLMEKIVNKKYLGTNKTNNYLNEYWRLGFPFTIDYYLKKINKNTVYGLILDDVILSYDSNDKLIVNTELKNNLLDYILEVSKEKSIVPSIINNIIDPFDNNNDAILTPIKAIKLFEKYMEPINENTKIINTYILDLHQK